MIENGLYRFIFEFLLNNMSSAVEHRTAAGLSLERNELNEMYVIMAAVGTRAANCHVGVVFTSKSSTLAIARWKELMDRRDWTQVGSRQIYLADVGYELYRIEGDLSVSLMGNLRPERKNLEKEMSEPRILPQL